MKGATKTIGTAARFLALAIFLILAIGPLYWIVVTSLKGPKEIYTSPLLYWPSHPGFASYVKLFSFSSFGTYFMNSLLVSVIAAAGALVICAFSGFALSRYKFQKEKGKILLAFYFTQMVPGFIIMVPLYAMMAKIGLTDNLLVLGVIYISMTIAFSTIMAKGFFDNIPASIEEAAMIDGCTTTQALFRIILPVMLPGLAAIFAFAFVNVWNELFLAVMLLSSEGNMTVPVALNSFISKAGISWDVMSAGIVVALVPTMIVFGIGQKYIVAGLTAGSVKG
jgi:multiple sugar transport system permease protein